MEKSLGLDKKPDGEIGSFHSGGHGTANNEHLQHTEMECGKQDSHEGSAVLCPGGRCPPRGLEIGDYADILKVCHAKSQ